jgi:hypothetical protein
MRKGVPAVGQALDHDRDRLVTFYEFPKARWKHLRATNPVESPLRGRPPAEGRGEAIQEGRERDGGDLEDAADWNVGDDRHLSRPLRTLAVRSA